MHPTALDDAIGRPTTRRSGSLLRSTMDVFHGTSVLTRPLREPVVAIGNFDGVHLGHQRLIAVAAAAARARGGEAVVLTFDPHPARVLAPKLAPPLICTLARRLELLGEQQVQACVIEPFTPALAEKPAAAFEREVLAGGLAAREVVVGDDFTYGAGRLGTAATLAAAGHALGIAVHVVPGVTIGGLRASSTKIRELVLEGNVEGAQLLLGRPFDVDGRVVRGDGRGRRIGFPTANVATDNELLPRPGVYAATVSVLDGPAPATRLPAVVNLGQNPTFVTISRLSLEAHLFDVDLELYDRRLRVAFRSWLRDEERFPSAEALANQIRRDILAARARLGSDPRSA